MEATARAGAARARATGVQGAAHSAPGRMDGGRDRVPDPLGAEALDAVLTEY